MLDPYLDFFTANLVTVSDEQVARGSIRTFSEWRSAIKGYEAQKCLQIIVGDLNNTNENYKYIFYNKLSL